MSVGLKNVCRTAWLPGANQNTASSPARTTSVLIVDAVTLRRLPPERRNPAAIPGEPAWSGLNGGDTGVNLQVLVLELLQRAVRPQRGQRLVHAGDQRVALGEQQ